ncbi:hypothetical protein A3726_02505 [Erythrobacter sp. HI0037]|nr:hypothetical protein A3719_13810 [Erythrobacter sp. HI0020]KZY12922.1 hypothetical protein A3726_02505 [Erythrobacter sp. HI0037]KZY15190.1 hypothetical protein A3727_19800 [Erythrobacter sp. HI0038]KZY17462.1 hypothetical protein A3727_05480 [Erythrobacter sp. HI0038]
MGAFAHESTALAQIAQHLLRRLDPDRANPAQIRCSLWQASAGTNAFNEAMRSTRCAQINRSMLR